MFSDGLSAGEEPPQQDRAVGEEITMAKKKGRKMPRGMGSPFEGYGRSSAGGQAGKPAPSPLITPNSTPPNEAVPVRAKKRKRG
jgi:hypothetical protein